MVTGVELPAQLVNLHDQAALVGLAVIAVLLIWSRLPRPLPSIPAPLVAVVGATALATMLALDVERVLLPGSLLDSLSLPDVAVACGVGCLSVWSPWH